MTPARNSPVLVYDGDCGICYEWVQYWKQLTGDRVSYRPYQDVQSDYPNIHAADFEKAIQYVDGDGEIRSGANAAFAVYSHVPGYAVLEWLYRHVPGFSLLSEFFYHFFSQRRALLGLVTHLCWGRDHQPGSYRVITRLFSIFLGCIYLAAFLSLSSQVTGLVGTQGILPLDQYLLQLQEHLGPQAYWRAPMLFWFILNDPVLQLTCILGALLACMLILNIYRRGVLILMYLLYLSLFYAGQTFMTFQWDLLLLEAGFLAIFLGTGSKIVVWLYRWLVFRFMFLGGLVKIISQDPAWDNLTALNYHFETQPLPTIFAWYAHYLPDFLLMTGVALTLIIELVLPFFIFTPRRFRITAACCFILFQSLIILSGNYNFFNLLTIAICLFLFDDAAVRSCLPRRLTDRMSGQSPGPANNYSVYLLIPLALVILFSSIEQMINLTGNREHRTPTFVSKIISPWHFVQNYGPFAVMTTVRREIVIEGSKDGINWEEYHFKFKPGDVSKSPSWATPHQPRLDWQMWFAALSPPERNAWFRNLLYRLLTDSKPVTGLLAKKPFTDDTPVFVRARFYEYRFASPAHKAATGEWWTRAYIGDYYPPIRLTMQVGK